MKIPVMFYVVFTTLCLVALTVMVGMGLPFHGVYYVMIFGQLMMLIMVYKVLRDNYRTNKTFKDFYEDHSVSND